LAGSGRHSGVKLVIDPASTERPMSFWNTRTHDWQIPSGSFGIAVGGSVTDNRLTGSFPVS
jgi:hypothetical protein